MWLAGSGVRRRSARSQRLWSQTPASRRPVVVDVVHQVRQPRPTRRRSLAMSVTAGNISSSSQQLHLHRLLLSRLRQARRMSAAHRFSLTPALHGRMHSPTPTLSVGTFAPHGGCALDPAGSAEYSPNTCYIFHKPAGCLDITLIKVSVETELNKKHLKNVGPIRHCEPPHAACFTLPFTSCRYCRTPPLSHAACASMSTTTTTTTTTTRDSQRGPLWPHRMGPIKSHVAVELIHKQLFDL